MTARQNKKDQRFFRSKRGHNEFAGAAAPLGVAFGVGESQGEQPMKRWLSLAISILALAVAPTTVMAGQDSVHFGPIISGSPDSGTCRPVWANDTYMRVFDAATTTTGGKYTVTESFIAGRFVTVAGSSPDACDPTGIAGSTIGDGVTGTFSGNFQVVVSNGVFNPSAACDSGCDTTAGFVASVYGAAATYDVPSFGFTYHANGPDLIQREWHNASGDQGGNSGDIRSS
jgi:hypothetical protein